MTDLLMFQVQHISNRSRSPEMGDKGRLVGPTATAERVRLFLKNETFLGSLSDTSLDALIRRGHVRKYSPGDFLCRRGDRADTVMVIITGWIKITNSNADGKEVVLNFLGAGDTIGEIGVLDGNVRTADAIALTETEVFLVYARDLLPILAAHPQTLIEIVHMLCEKLRAASAIIEDSSLDMRRRIAKGLLRLAWQHGRTSKEGIRVNLRASQSELGGYLGLSRENVNRQLCELRDANVIVNDGPQIIIINEPALYEIAEGPLARTWSRSGCLGEAGMTRRVGIGATASAVLS